MKYIVVDRERSKVLMKDSWLPCLWHLICNRPVDLIIMDAGNEKYI